MYIPPCKVPPPLYWTNIHLAQEEKCHKRPNSDIDMRLQQFLYLFMSNTTILVSLADIKPIYIKIMPILYFYIFSKIDKKDTKLAKRVEKISKP